MRLGDVAKVGVALFAAALLQVSVISQINILGGTPNLLLVTLACIALLRGSIVGASGGFFAGLVLDTARLDTLGVSSLLLTIAGYWIGRYGETASGRTAGPTPGRNRTHAPLVSVAVITMLFTTGGLALRFVLGETVDTHFVLVDALPAAIVLNALATLPVYALCRRLLPPRTRAERAREVGLLG